MKHLTPKEEFEQRDDARRLRNIVAALVVIAAVGTALLQWLVPPP